MLETPIADRMDEALKAEHPSGESTGSAYLLSLEAALLENLHRSARAADRAFVSFLVAASLAYLVGRGYVTVFTFFGNSIGKVSVLLAVLLPFGSFEHYRAVKARHLSEGIWRALWSMQRKLHPEFAGRGLTSLLIPPTLLDIETHTLRASLKQHTNDELWGLGLWATFVIGPVLFQLWALVQFFRSDDAYAIGTIITVVFSSRALIAGWRSMNS